MDKTEKLILCVRQHRCLYDIGDIAYKNYTKKCLIWEHIAKELDETVEGVKIKWKHIRDGYTKYKKLRHIPPSTGKKEKYQNWVWGPQLGFLDDCVQPRPRIKNLLPKKRKVKDEPQQNSQEATASTSFQDHFIPPLLESDYSETMSQNSEQFQSADISNLSRDLSNQQNESSDPFREIDNSHFDSSHIEESSQLHDSSHSQESSHIEDKDLEQSLETEPINVDRDALENQNKNDNSDPLQGKGKTGKITRKRKKSDGITLLFNSYSYTFKNLNPQTQAALKINLAQLFYEAEIRELNPANVPT